MTPSEKVAQRKNIEHTGIIFVKQIQHGRILLANKCSDINSLLKSKLASKMTHQNFIYCTNIVINFLFSTTFSIFQVFFAIKIK